MIKPKKQTKFYNKLNEKKKTTNFNYSLLCLVSISLLSIYPYFLHFHFSPFPTSTSTHDDGSPTTGEPRTLQKPKRHQKKNKRGRNVGNILTSLSHGLNTTRSYHDPELTTSQPSRAGAHDNTTRSYHDPELTTS